jgi:crotonobetainyl-CoA:carnitine CoA-transferase CaiB-like acyl-CoA transferase
MYDTVAQAMSGYLSMFVRPEEPRITGRRSLMASRVYRRIRRARRPLRAGEDGKRVPGRSLHARIDDAFLDRAIAHYFTSGVSPGPDDRARLAQSYAFTCSDGKLIAIHLLSPDKF